MAKFRIHYYHKGEGSSETEEVEASKYQEEGEWIEFVETDVSAGGLHSRQVLRVRGKDVRRIERVEG